MHDFEIVLGLLLGATIVIPVARRLDIPVAIAQVVAGLVMSVAPFLPTLRFDPELVFAALVPPLLYRAAATNSWRDIRRQAAPILVLAVATVFLTAIAVATIVHVALPRVSWPTALLLGATVSPSDADVTTSIARRLGLPSRLVTILEGETLLNDTAAFMIYRLAMSIVILGSVSVLGSIVTFIRLIVIGVAVGLVIAGVTAWWRGRLREPVAEAAISLLTPFASYLIAERCNGSGVLAVVVTGICVSRFLPRLASPCARVRALLLWEITTFAIGGFIFVLIGFQLGRASVRFAQADGGTALRIVALVTVSIVAVRLLCASVLSLLGWLSHGSTVGRISQQSWRELAILGWTGLRGGDTLVMVVALPLTVAGGRAFADRNLIITAGLGVILATVLLQGLTLRPLIKLLEFPRDGEVDGEERVARTAAERAAVARLRQLVQHERWPDSLRQYVESVIRQRTLLAIDSIDHMFAHEGSDDADALRTASQAARDAARRAVLQLWDDETIGDAALNRVLADLDLDDLRAAAPNP